MSTYAPRFPDAQSEYGQENESAFRREVVRALQDVDRSIRGEVEKGVLFPTSILGWTNDLTFSASGDDTVAWGAGTISLQDGTSYSIGAGNTGAMADTTYIYFDLGVSDATLQTTTSASSAVGNNRILVAVAEPAAATANDATFIVYGGSGGATLSQLVDTANLVAEAITNVKVATNAIATTNIQDDAITTPKLVALAVTTEKLEALSITAAKVAAGAIETEKLAAESITAAKIAAGTITANEIAANTITGTEIFAMNLTGKTLTADTGTIGGWSLAAGTLSSGNVTLSASAERLLFGAATEPLTGVGIFLGLDGADYEFRAGDPGGDFIHWDGTNLTLTGSMFGTIEEAAVLAHEAALTILESQITDGSVLARLGDGETVTGAWTFTDLLTINRGSDEQIRLDHASATGSPYISFYQDGNERANIQYQDSGDRLTLINEGGNEFVLRSTDSPFLAFIRHSDGSRVGYVQGQDDDDLVFFADNGPMRFYPNGTEAFRIAYNASAFFLTSVDTVLQLRVNSATGSPLLGWYQESTRRAYINFNDTGDTFNIVNQVDEVRLFSADSLAVTIDSNQDLTCEGDVIATVP